MVKQHVELYQYAYNAVTGMEDFINQGWKVVQCTAVRNKSAFDDVIVIYEKEDCSVPILDGAKGTTEFLKELDI